MIATLDAIWCADHPLSFSKGGQDKEARGTVLVVGGSARIPGAPVLTGEAALRAGAGKVQLGVVESVAPVVGINFPEAAVLALPVDEEGEITKAAAEALRRCAQSCDVLAIGPGIGTSTGIAPLLEALLDMLDPEAAVVLDAGALEPLNHLKRGFADRPNPCVITPHHGELARLLRRDRDAVSADPERAASEAAERFGVVVTSKSETTFVADPGGAMLRYVSEAPGLGTAGSGDVLAGVIAGLLGQGIDPLTAAAWGVRIHGEAGRAAGTAIGTMGYLARDLLGFVPRLVSASV